MKVVVDPLTGLPTISNDTPVVVSSSGGAAGGVRSVRAGSNVIINNTDPMNPIISATGGGGGGGGGDMYTAIYDVDNSGVVDDSQALNGQPASYYLNRTNHNGTQAAATITGLATVATTGDYNDLNNKPTIPAAYTDEQAQDAVGTILTDTSTLDFTYNDGANTISAAVLDSPTVNGNDSTYLLNRTNHTGTQAQSTVTNLVSDLAATEKTANKNQVNGYAGLDGSGKVAAAQLPSYVDDVVEVANFAGLPGTGETGKIYVTLDTGKLYRWSGSSYVEISASPGSTDAVPEGSTNLYYTNARASAAAPVQSVAGKTGVVSLVKGDVGLANVDNTADATKNVLSATKLTTARNINGVAFDGTANITVTDATKEPIVTGGTTAQYYRGDKTFQTLDKTAVGLGNVDNTSDVNKPVSTAQASAIALKQNLVTLTTTGSSGAATFNQATGALNIPSYAGGAGSTTINYFQQTASQEFTYAASNAFVLSQAQSAILAVSVNGQLFQTSEYSVVTNTVTVTPASHTFVTGEKILIIYETAQVYNSNGGFKASVVTKTANYSMTTNDYFVRMSAASGNVIATLPDATTCTGQVFVINKIDSSINTVTIQTTSGQIIGYGSATTSVIMNQGTASTLISTGAGYDSV